MRRIKSTYTDHVGKFQVTGPLADSIYLGFGLTAVTCTCAWGTPLGGKSAGY
jgi:hypothetical protein